MHHGHTLRLCGRRSPGCQSIWCWQFEEMAAVLGWTTFLLGAWLGVYALLWSAGAGRLGGPWALTWVFTELVCGVDARVTGHLAT